MINIFPTDFTESHGLLLKKISDNLWNLWERIKLYETISSYNHYCMSEPMGYGGEYDLPLFRQRHAADGSGGSSIARQ